MAGEMHDVVAAVAQQRAQFGAGEPAVDPRIARAIEIDDAAGLLAGLFEPAGHLLGFIARTRQLSPADIRVE